VAQHVHKTKRLSLRPFQAKNHMWIFVNCQIENPAFDSQTKCTLTTTPESFGSICDVDQKFIKRVLTCGIIDRVMHWAKMKEASAFSKTDGVVKRNLGNQARTQTTVHTCHADPWYGLRGLVGIPKLDDANCAGGPRGKECTLILTEGDSAKALAVSGLGVVGRDLYGVFPLRGKLLNVREASHKQIMMNVEITALKKILGLQAGKTYTSTDTDSLRCTLHSTAIPVIWSCNSCMLDVYLSINDSFKDSFIVNSPLRTLRLFCHGLQVRTSDAHGRSGSRWFPYQRPIHQSHPLFLALSPANSRLCSGICHADCQDL
jgi:hypothetical protein